MLVLPHLSAWMPPTKNLSANQKWLTSRRVAALLVVILAARSAVEQERVGMVVHRLGVADQLVAG